MVNRQLLRQFDAVNAEDEIDAIFNQHREARNLPEEEPWLESESQDYELNKIVTGKVIEIRGEDIIIDIGYKSEGIVKIDEWRDEGVDGPQPPKVGDTIQVLLETVEDENGQISLSYRKAKRQKEWEAILARHKEGDIVSGMVTRKIKGGLLVNIGVNVFLPASQVDIRRPPDIGDYLNRSIECKILKIDESRRNIVVSRRKLIEDQRQEMKQKLLSEIEPKQTRKGVVKNIAEFGAFVDLGGIDGLLHITDMSWGRVTNPNDVVRIDQELEVYILSVDKEREKIALSLKHKSASPWENVEAKYPVNSRHIGEVVNIMTYGAFVKLEPGIEGLVHISEMSWTKRINDPRELVQPGDRIEVMVLNINRDKQEISLGMKQTLPNPWDKVAERYPPNTQITGTVRNLTNYGAFIEIEEGIDGLLHVSDMSWVRKVTHPSEVVQKGQKVTCVVLNVDQERKRVALGLKQMANDPWEGDIPARYHPNDSKRGKVTKITNFGVFVELEPGLEGLLHISELSDQKVENAEELVKVGDEVDVRILRVDAKDRKIGLSRRTPSDDPVETEESAATTTEGETSSSESAASGSAASAPAKRELRGGTGTAGPLFSMPGEATDAAPEENA
ncbi:30S ribosomal protein S1 [Tuwongella immobilis]|uniref:Small ribosomal subunit protein bS1 n=1 Tax=Tuwongella immobilis TaxID=692036 RepID=A0A6C2YH91_9BACT|nr:30S ribosomal protein S1 [Tuwongella immobilis]VIP00724.1 30s ribosomal protein s1 : 30S ribosomal protein S1 OS=Isosphaera pallida (strain ATCC 43644 / DSM 9630 / IS1B) GN=Isop_1182 PE=3 SV=1: S1: S1: S1: S1: S1: S1 [Tuwongella immobilis]VTR96866.1 30s ribosomal protein s1 : 30S ribosomal protein S1 OS=Isosphaera pallida (strain ATCC 43644 / DSM 9630 / IS1B) GN=Isop_1182 PE=3 SV=1: S1: S1: S1: S1: S1: S1 [Tuwongella immobilis]